MNHHFLQKPQYSHGSAKCYRYGRGSVQHLRSFSDTRLFSAEDSLDLQFICSSSQYRGPGLKDSISYSEIEGVREGDGVSGNGLEYGKKCTDAPD